MVQGPGTRIKLYLNSWGINTKDGGCGCDELAQKMDAAGRKQVMTNLEYYVEAMQISSKEWFVAKTGVPIRPPRAILRQMIKWACSEEDIHER